MDANQAARKLAVTRQYVEWFVATQSGDADLAAKLSDQFQRGWTHMASLIKSQLPSRDVAAEMQRSGFSILLVGCGKRDYYVPGRSVTFLIMDQEFGCNQITLERWSSIADVATNVALIGMSRKDTRDDSIEEKQIHLAAFTLPRRGDYLEITTQSLSPLGKVIVAFVGLALTSGCEPAPSAPAPAPCTTNVTITNLTLQSVTNTKLAQTDLRVGVTFTSSNPNCDVKMISITMVDQNGKSMIIPIMPGAAPGPSGFTGELAPSVFAPGDTLTVKTADFLVTANRPCSTCTATLVPSTTGYKIL